METIVNKSSKYLFQHKPTGAKLSFEADNDQAAIMTLGKLCQTVMDWDMKKFRLSKTKRKKLKRNESNI